MIELCVSPGLAPDFTNFNLDLRLGPGPIICVIRSGHGPSEINCETGPASAARHAIRGV